MYVCVYICSHVYANTFTIHASIHPLKNKVYGYQVHKMIRDPK